ncbi:MAG: glycosyltransferase [Dysgonomonas sp.]
MKIFQVITVSEHGGAQSVVLNLTNSLCTDNELYVLSGGDGEAWENMNKKAVRIKISDHRKGISIKDIAILFRLYYYRLKYKPDIVHLHCSKIGALGRLAFNKKKIIYTMHGFDSLRLGFRKFLFVEKLLKNRHAIIIGVSRHDVDGLIAEGIDKKPELIYNGLEDYTLQSDKDKIDVGFLNKIENIKSQYPKVIMCISRISKQKKFELFVDIAKELPQYAFVWIGNKEPMSGLPSNVFCLGEINAAHIYLKYADLFILPTNYEGLPVSIIEALMYSIPVVASAVGGIPEILDGKNGFYVENDVQVFKEKIEYSLDEKNHENMSQAARESYLNKFTVDKMVDSYKLLYSKII